MKLKNIGHKVISVGETVILPGKTEEVKGYDESNAALNCLIKKKELAVVKEKTTGRGK